MKKECLTLRARRSSYGLEINNTLSVRELIDILSEYDDDTKVCINNDNGYTYGYITYDDFQIECEDDEESECEE